MMNRKRQTLMVLCQSINEELNPDADYYQTYPDKGERLLKDLETIRLTDVQFDVVQSAITALETIAGYTELEH